MKDPTGLEITDQEKEHSGEPPLRSVAMPDPFWPTALGLDPNREVAFLRSLSGSDPLLCLLHVPDEANMQDWLQATWEGLMSWAYRSAKRFARSRDADSANPDLLIGPATLLHTYLKTSVLKGETPGLLDRTHCINLISLKKDAEFPVDFPRLQAAWPGVIHEFDPTRSVAVAGQGSADVSALLACLALVAGLDAVPTDNLSPLKLLLWSKEACTQVLARGSIQLGHLLSSEELRKFKGSNKSATALALKAHLAGWVKKNFANSTLQFEENQVKEIDECGTTCKVNHIDLLVHGKGRFEVETFRGSGPMEAFYHQKVFSRLKDEDTPFWLVVPNEAVLWAGPLLADLAHHLGVRGHVIVPGAGDTYIQLQGRPLGSQEISIEVPWDELTLASAANPELRVDGSWDEPLRLRDVAGYADIREHVEELIIWPEKHRRAFRGPSRSSGILFFGPPSCGKSRLARAIAGELEQEVRLLGPSDLRGAYVGWGQILIREQFDWVAEHERRMLVIDELDAIARSRRDVGNMHEDEKASVNELLVQLDRVSRLGRLIVGTTNYVDSLDDAVVRSGRFGRFVPVPPPNVDESVAILDFYLKRLTIHGERDNQPRVSVPEASTVRPILATLFAENARESRYYCGADLEEAVNRTYLRCLRQTLGATWPENYGDVIVNLTGDELTRSLRDVPRSVTADAASKFIEDANRYCGPSVGIQLSQRFQEGAEELRDIRV
jgi:hypothetical protein